MTMAVTKAVERGRAGGHLRVDRQHLGVARPPTPRGPGITCAVLVPQGKIALGKLAQALMHGAQDPAGRRQLRRLPGAGPQARGPTTRVALVNSRQPDRIQGQKTAAFEIVDVLGDAPDVHCLPVGNAGNITAYWQGYREYAATG